MTSKISYYKIALEDLRRRIWMLALSCLGNVLALPVAFLIVNRDYIDIIERNLAQNNSTELFLRYYGRFLSNYGLICLAAVSMIGALIVGLLGFRYLYSRKMTDLYHSIPIRRSRMFLITYLNGLLIYLIPMLLSMVILFLLIFANLASYGALSAFGSIFLTACHMMVSCIVSFLIIYHLSLVCVMLSGNAFNALCLTGIFGTAIAALFGMFEMLSSSFLDNFHSMGITWDQIVWASPLVSPFFLLTNYMDMANQLQSTGTAASVFAHPAIFYIATILVMAANLVIAFRLYLKRPSETAEHGVDIPAAQSIVRIATALIAGLFGSYMFLMIMDREAIGWHLFGILLCGCLAFGIIDIILHMNFHSFFAHKKQMAAALLISCGLFLILAYDLTGYDKRLPDQDNIANAQIQLNTFTDDSRRYQYTTDGEIILDYYDSYYDAIPFSDIDLLYPLLEQLTDDNHENLEMWNTRIHVILDTKVGPFRIPFRRTYRILEEDLTVLRPIIESKEYLEASYPASLGLAPSPASMAVSSNLVHSEEYIADAGLIGRLREAYTADFTAHATLEYLNSGMIVGHMNLQYPQNLEGTKHLYSLSLPVYAHYENTIAVIREAFPHLALTREDLDITSLTVYTDKLELFGIAEEETIGDTAYTAEDIKVQTETVVTYQLSATAEYLGHVTLTDPEELAMLLPYLQPGDYDSSNFESLHDHTYLGRLTTATGHSIACYVADEDLPLPIPASLPETLEEAARELEAQTR